MKPEGEISVDLISKLVDEMQHFTNEAETNFAQAVAGWKAFFSANGITSLEGNIFEKFNAASRTKAEKAYAVFKKVVVMRGVNDRVMKEANAEMDRIAELNKSGKLRKAEIKKLFELMDVEFHKIKLYHTATGNLLKETGRIKNIR